MFQFHQNNSQLLFHVIVSPWGAGAFSRGFTKILARQCRAFSRALKIKKLKAPLFPGPGGAGDANDWCITRLYYGIPETVHLNTSQCLLQSSPLLANERVSTAIYLMR